MPCLLYTSGSLSASARSLPVIGSSTSQQSVVRADLADDQIGCQNQDKAYNRLIQAHRGGHSDVDSTGCQIAIHINVYDHADAAKLAHTASQQIEQVNR